MRDEWKACVHRIGKNNNYDIGDEDEEHLQHSEELFAQRYGQRLVYNGIPTIFKIHSHNGQIQYYTGDRSEGDMYRWIVSKHI